MPHKYANFIAAFKFQWNTKKKKKKKLRTQFTYYTYLMLGEANAFATNGNFVHKTI